MTTLLCLLATARAMTSTLPAAPTTVSYPFRSVHTGRAPPRRPSEDVATIGDLTVPSVALGTISWTPEREHAGFRPGDRLDGKIGTAAAQDAVAATALGAGATFFDTAERYSVGVGETLLAEALERGAASRTRRPFGAAAPAPVVATKFTPAPWRAGADAVVEACRASRDRLGVDTIDLYQLHMPDVVQPGRAFGYVDVKDEAYWDGLARCKELGLVREIGVSNYGPTLLRRCCAFMEARGLKVASNQIHYSLLARHDGNQATVDAARELGVATLAYYPLAMGLLTNQGALRRGPLEHYARGGTGLVGAPWVAANRVAVPAGGVAPLVDALRLVGKRRGKTPSQVALNWVIGSGAIPVAGATSPKYVLDAAGARGWRLTADERRELEAASDDLGFEFRGTFFKRVDSKFVGYGVESWKLD